EKVEGQRSCKVDQHEGHHEPEGQQHAGDPEVPVPVLHVSSGQLHGLSSLYAGQVPVLPSVSRGRRPAQNGTSMPTCTPVSRSSCLATFGSNPPSCRIVRSTCSVRPSRL